VIYAIPEAESTDDLAVVDAEATCLERLRQAEEGAPECGERRASRGPRHSARRSADSRGVYGVAAAG